tara:strand:- start:586 stop:1044 length:459 start_codon:yes stop_codon:yes gene_type:complete
MKLDINKANELLNKSGIARANVAETDADTLFNELVYARFKDNYTDDEDIDEELHDAMYAAVFEMKDLDFCLIDEKDNWAGACITLCVGYRADRSWDQHMEVAGVTTDNATDKWETGSEQMYEYRGSKDIATFRKEFEALGATYSTELEGFVT